MADKPKSKKLTKTQIRLKRKSPNQVEFNRPSWDEYFLLMSFCASLRSEDRFIKHGAIIVDKSNHYILSTGYNGTIKGADDSYIDHNDRDGRRPWMIHAEENAILNCTNHPRLLKNGAIIYVTGKPCTNCLQRIINYGINEICYADRVGSITESAEDQLMRKKLIKLSKINVRTVKCSNLVTRVDKDLLRDIIKTVVYFK
jgi:dCMP deaminase